MAGAGAARCGSHLPPLSFALPSLPPNEVNSQIETRRSLQLVKMRKVQEMSNNFSNDINPFHVYDKRRRGQRGAAAAGGPGGGGEGGAAGKGDGKHCEICMCHSCSHTTLLPSMAYGQLPHVCVCVCVCGGVAGFTLGSTAPACRRLLRCAVLFSNVLSCTL